MSLHTRDGRHSPLLLLTAGIRGFIFIIGLWLIIAPPNETMRLFGVIAAIFGAVRLYLLYRQTTNDNDETDS